MIEWEPDKTARTKPLRVQIGEKSVGPLSFFMASAQDSGDAKPREMRSIILSVVMPQKAQPDSGMMSPSVNRKCEQGSV